MRNLAWLLLERVLVRAVYLTVTVLAAALLQPAALAVALAANALVVLPQAFGDQSVNGLVIRRSVLSRTGARRVRHTILIVGLALAALTAVASVPVQRVTGIPDLAAVGAALALIIPVAAHAGVSTAVLQRAGRQRSASVARALAALSSGAVWVPVLAVTASPWALVGFYLTTDLVAAMSTWWLSRHVLETEVSGDESDVRAAEILRFMAAVGPANLLNWLSSTGFGLVCAVGLSVTEYAELGLYLAILRVALDLLAGPFTANLQVGLSRIEDREREDALIIRYSNYLGAATLLAVTVVLLLDPTAVLGLIGKEEFDSVLLLWLLASLPIQAVAWLDRPVLIHRHLERTDLQMRALFAVVDTALALSAGVLGLPGLGVAVALRYVFSRLVVDRWFGAHAVHCRMRQAWPTLAFVLMGGAGILLSQGRPVMAAASVGLAAVVMAREVRGTWTLSSSTDVMRSGR